MLNKKIVAAVAGLAIILTGCANNSSKTGAPANNQPFAAQVVSSNDGTQQQIAGRSTKGKTVYYKIDKGQTTSIPVKNKKFTINVPASLNTRKVKISQKQKMTKPLKLTVKKPDKVIDSKKFAKGFNKSKQMDAKMPTKTPKLDRIMNLMFSPITTYKLLSDENHIYSLQLAINDNTSSEVKQHITALAAGLDIKKSDLNDLVSQAKKHKGQKQIKDLNNYHITTLVDGKKLTVSVTK